MRLTIIGCAAALTFAAALAGCAPSDGNETGHISREYKVTPVVNTGRSTGLPHLSGKYAPILQGHEVHGCFTHRLSVTITYGYLVSACVYVGTRISILLPRMRPLTSGNLATGRPSNGRPGLLAVIRSTRLPNGAHDTQLQTLAAGTAQAVQLYDLRTHLSIPSGGDACSCPPTFLNFTFTIRDAPKR